MQKQVSLLTLLFSFLLFHTGHGQVISQPEDELNSLRLQRHVHLTLLTTDIPGDKEKMNLLLLNDGQDMDQFRAKIIMDSLYRKNLIGPLLIVGIHAGDRLKEYGVAGIPDYLGRGNLAKAYENFIVDELYPYLKKKMAVRQFHSVVMAGCSLGGLSAFDMAWEHAGLINKVGVFSGSFWWRDKDDKAADYSDEKNRIMLSKVRSSGKRARLQYWFYAGAMEEKGDRDKDGIIDVVDDTRDLIQLISNKNGNSAAIIKYTEDKTGQHDYPWWSRQLPAFLTGAGP